MVPSGLRPLVRSAVLIGLVFGVGVVGYGSLAGPQYSWFDAVYFTVITLTTVGYSETIDLSQNPAARAFTVGLLFLGVGTFIYFVSNLTAFLVEGTVDRIWEKRKMDKRIAALSGHEIVAGAGKTGAHVVAELLATGRDFVLVEGDEARVRALQAELGDFPAVIGDATVDASLEAAGVARARGLVSCVSNDKDNLVVTFSARLLNQKLRIVARCVDPETEGKIRRAGADSVVSPNAIGGLRLVSELVRPTAVSFLDVMLRERHGGLRIEEVCVQAGAPLDGCALRDLRGLGVEGMLVVALRGQDDAWHFNPDGACTIESGSRVVFIGGPAVRARMDALAEP